MAADEQLTDGQAALAEGRWEEARVAFVAAATGGETAEACFGLAAALWWLGDNVGSVDRCTRAYGLYRRAGDTAGAVQCAVWLAIIYKANFANEAVANGWTARAQRLLAATEPGPLHGWLWTAQAYRMADLADAARLTAQAVEVATAAGDVDLELAARSQLGLIRVGQGECDAGFALIDEAVAMALAGEGSNLDTVVYACCDMLNACELTSDLERAVQWCQVADEFARTYGCPFLYAECRISYGTVLAAKGRWSEAERELAAGMRMTAASCPGLHVRAASRLAALRVRQGRLEDAEALLDGVGRAVDLDADASLAVGALLLARGDAAGAGRGLARRLHRVEGDRMRLASALGLLVAAQAAAGRLAAARASAERLAGIVGASGNARLRATLATAQARVAAAAGDAAVTDRLEEAVAGWWQAGLPFETARAESELAHAVSSHDPARAVTHARRARATLVALGASAEADRLAALLRSLGVPDRPGRRGPGPLTGREQEVLALVAAGLSNPEIATRLYISRKTAAHHVSRVLAKLGCRNRAEAAAHAARALHSP